MEKKTSIVNQLPVKTWNRLNVNDNVLEQYEAESPCPVQSETENGTAQITDVAEWEDNGIIATGVGSAIDRLFPWAVTVTAWNECVDTVRMEIGSTAGKKLHPAGQRAGRKEQQPHHRADLESRCTTCRTPHHAAR